MKFEDFKLGKQYQSTIGGVNSIATCIAVNKKGDAVLLGWASSDPAIHKIYGSGYTSKRNGTPNPLNDYISNQTDYTYYLHIRNAGGYASTIKFFEELSSVTSLTSSIAEDNWRAWAHNVPGECPCGIKRQDCIYHQS